MHKLRMRIRSESAQGALSHISFDLKEPLCFEGNIKKEQEKKERERRKMVENPPK